MGEQTRFKWYAPDRPKSGEVLAGEIVQGEQIIAQVHIARSSVLKPVWLIYVTTLGTRFPMPIVAPVYDKALQEAHAILRNGIDPGFHEQNSIYETA